MYFYLSFFKFLEKKIEGNFLLPEIGNYAVGVIFMPKEKNDQEIIKNIKVVIELSNIYKTSDARIRLAEFWLAKT